MNRRALMGKGVAVLAALAVPFATVASAPVPVDFWSLSDAERSDIRARAFGPLDHTMILAPEFAATLASPHAAACALAMAVHAIPQLAASFVERGELRPDFDPAPYIRRAMKENAA